MTPPVTADCSWSSIRTTSGHSYSAWARVGTIGALGIAAIGVVDLFGAPTGAQTAVAVNEVVSAATDGTPIGGESSAPSLSDDGSVVVFSNATGDTEPAFQLFVRTRAAGDAAARTDLLYPGADESSAVPVLGAVSGDGCTVAYSAIVPAPAVADTTTTTTTTTTSTVAVDEGVEAGEDGENVGAADGAGGEVADDTGAAENDAAGESASDGQDPSDVEGAGDAGAVDSGTVAREQTVGATTELRMVDRCVPEGIAPDTVVLDVLTGEMALPSPALATDGATIAWAMADEVRVYSEASVADTPVFTSVRSGVLDDVVGDAVDLSGDGRTVVFESGQPNLDFESDDEAAIKPGEPILTNVYIAALPASTDPAETTPIVSLLAPSRAGSSSPSITADGALVTYGSDDPGLLADAPADGSYLVLVDRSAVIADPLAGVATQRVLTTGAVDAQLSADGRSVVYNAFESVRVRRSDTDAAFEDSTEVVVNTALSAQFGEAVGASRSVPAISGDGSVAVFDHVADVDLTTDASLRVDGHVWAVDTTTIFEPPAAPTTVADTTTTLAPSTLPVGTPPPSVQVTAPRNTTRTTIRTTTRNTTRNTTRTTTRNTSRASTTTAVDAPPAFEPAAFEFAPTIAGAGRRTAELSLFNASTKPTTVSAVALQPADAGFSVDATTCNGSIGAGQRCAVTVSFIPSAAGEATANLVATLADGSTATSALRGLGAPAPTLSVLPGVASNGQVVTVFGAGFPAGAIVEFSWNDGQVESNIVINDTGGFSETLVILPNTATGPADVAVAGQTDLFGDVSASILVTNTGGRGSTAVLSGGVGGGGLGR